MARSDRIAPRPPSCILAGTTSPRGASVFRCDAGINAAHYRQLARHSRGGKVRPDLPCGRRQHPGDDLDALSRTAIRYVGQFEPLTLLSHLSAVTERIGLVATASTTYNEPFHVARKFASLDHLSGGRAGWNLVTSADPREAWNFSRESHLAHANRYARRRSSSTSCAASGFL